MSFNSFEFLLFFAAVFPLYCALDRRNQNRLLLAASYIFYGWIEPRFVVLMALTTAADFYIGLRIEAAQSPRAKKRWLLASLVMNLSLLGVFKYYNFFALSAARFLPAWFRFCLRAVCPPPLPTPPIPPPPLNVALPAGISFYTFHEISYVVDVYKGHLKAARNFVDFAVFISFFPQLVAGPIGRATWQMPQFRAHAGRMTYEGWSEGLTLFVIGLFRKTVVADPMGLLAKHVFANPERCGHGTLLLGVYLFAFQIYADFAGYSEMARGLARAMGFELIQNFEHPYFATDITAFWRRWHISLSTWLRDYLYIPLGGNRHGRWRTDLNLFLTMFLGGLWHGASWKFAVWGSLHGVYLALHKVLKGGRQSAAPPAHPVPVTESPAIPRFRHPRFTFVNVLKALGTFHLVALTWIFFAAEDIAKAWTYLLHLAVPGVKVPGAHPLTLRADDLLAAFGGTALMLAADRPAAVP